MPIGSSVALNNRYKQWSWIWSKQVWLGEMCSIVGEKKLNSWGRRCGGVAAAWGGMRRHVGGVKRRSACAGAAWGKREGCLQLHEGSVRADWERNCCCAATALRLWGSAWRPCCSSARAAWGRRGSGRGIRAAWEQLGCSLGQLEDGVGAMRGRHLFVLV